MSRSRVARRWTVLALAGAMALVGCGDDDPSGPGTLEGRVSAATELGAAVLLVQGGGSPELTGVGDTRAFSGPRASGSHRVVLVGEGSGELRFEIEVEDVSAPRPTVTVVSAADTENESVAAVSAVDVRLTIR